MAQHGDYRLELTCDSGLDQPRVTGHGVPATFFGDSIKEAQRRATAAGWRLAGDTRTRRAHDLCPACVLDFPGTSAPASMRKGTA